MTAPGNGVRFHQVEGASVLRGCKVSALCADWRSTFVALQDGRVYLHVMHGHDRSGWHLIKSLEEYMEQDEYVMALSSCSSMTAPVIAVTNKGGVIEITRRVRSNGPTGAAKTRVLLSRDKAEELAVRPTVLAIEDMWAYIRMDSQDGTCSYWKYRHPMKSGLEQYEVAQCFQKGFIEHMCGKHVLYRDAHGDDVKLFAIERNSKACAPRAHWQHRVTRVVECGRCVMALTQDRVLLEWRKDKGPECAAAVKQTVPLDWNPRYHQFYSRDERSVIEALFKARLASEGHLHFIPFELFTRIASFLCFQR